MWLLRSSWRFGIAAVLILSRLQVNAEEQLHTEAVVDDAVVDGCAPLTEAGAILLSLQPSPHAHLVDKLGALATSPRGWGEGLGWSRDGPLATTFRLLPRVLKSLSPVNIAQSFMPFKRARGAQVKISKARRDKVERLLNLVDEAEKNGCPEASLFLGRLRMFPPKGVRQDLDAAYSAFKRVLETTSDPESQFYIGFFHATGIGGVERDQGKAILHYTFSALQGFRPAEMALGYRHWAGIGMKEDCLLALDWYESAADRAYDTYLSGPPGGRTFPFTPTRLSDQHGGIYGPHASWASTGANSLRAAARAFTASSRGQTEREILEFYQYHSDRDSYAYTVSLGRLYYVGSVYPLLGGVSHGAEGVGEIPQDYRKAREYFMRAARQYWPTDFDVNGKVVPKRKMSKEQDDILRDPAMVAAAYLGRMAMRGEGQKVDYKRAKLWYERAAELGDREAHNGLGIFWRDGLMGYAPDHKKALAYFSAAAGRDLADAQINLAKVHIDRGEPLQAQQFLEAAIRNHSPFEAFYLLARLHSNSARAEDHSRPGSCGVSVAWFKMVAEKGNWGDDFIGDADRAWARGEEDKAMLGWWIAAEMGYEAGQNNVAFAMEKGVQVDWVRKVQERSKEMEAAGTELELWVRSAAQDNVDAMVKVGDLFYNSRSPEETRFARAANYYQTAADTQMSAMAYWNLGWMYEMGQGVPRDWHLAKRNYDLSMDTNSEAFLPATLSLVGLYLRSWWIDIRTRGEIPGLPLFEDDIEEDITPGIPPMGLWQQIKSLFSPFSRDDYDAFNNNDNDAVGTPGGHGGTGGTGEADYQDLSGAGSGWRTDPGAGEDADRLNRMMEEEGDVMESLGIMALMGLVGGLIMLRGRWAAAAEAREREERERVERERQVREGQRQARGQAQGQGQHALLGQHGERVQPGREVRIGEEGQREGERDAGLPVGWEPPLQ